MNQEQNVFYNNLSDEELGKLQNETNDEFNYKHSNNIYNLHILIEDYCKRNYLEIYDKVRCSFELSEFIIDNSTALEKMFIKNLKDEMKYKRTVEEEKYYQDRNQWS